MQAALRNNQSWQQKLSITGIVQQSRSSRNSNLAADLKIQMQSVNPGSDQEQSQTTRSFKNSNSSVTITGPPTVTSDGPSTQKQKPQFASYLQGERLAKSRQCSSPQRRHLWTSQCIQSCANLLSHTISWHCTFRQVRYDRHNTCATRMVFKSSHHLLSSLTTCGLNDAPDSLQNTLTHDHAMLCTDRHCSPEAAAIPLAHAKHQHLLQTCSVCTGLEPVFVLLPTQYSNCWNSSTPAHTQFQLICIIGIIASASYAIFAVTRDARFQRNGRD